jgi:hypothetical protein
VAAAASLNFFADESGTEMTNWLFYPIIHSSQKFEVESIE